MVVFNMPSDWKLTDSILLRQYDRLSQPNNGVSFVSYFYRLPRIISELH